MLLPSHRPRRARSMAPRRPGPVDPSLTALLHARSTWVCRIESALAPLGLSSRELGVLRRLGEADAPRTLEELAALWPLLGAKGPDTAIQSLLARGLIDAVPPRTGQGSARLRITPMGMSRQAEAASALHDVSAMFAAMIPGADRAALDRIVSNVRRPSGGLLASRVRVTLKAPGA